MSEKKVNNRSEDINISLKDFVDAFNKCNVYIAEDLGSGNSCVSLAKDFESLNNCCENTEEDNRIFYNYLKRHCKDRNKYSFLCKQDITANIQVFNPYIDGKINQKWHIMISLLALVDASRDDEFKKDMINGHYEDDLEKYKTRSINEITIKEDGTIKISGVIYRCGPMRKQVKEIMKYYNKGKC